MSSLSQGIEKQGHDVTVIDARTEKGRSLNPYAYVLIGINVPFFFAKDVPIGLSKFLSSAGMLLGRRCYAFVTGKGMRKLRLLKSLMKTMESEGMYLKKSDILHTPAEAEAIGARLHVCSSHN